MKNSKVMIDEQKLFGQPVRQQIQQITFTRNLAQEATVSSIIEEAKETVLDFSLGTVKVFFFFFFALI